MDRIKNLKLGIIVIVCLAAALFTIFTVTPAAAGFVNRLVVMGKLIVGGTTPLGEATVYGRTASEDTMVVRGPSSQTGDLQEWQLNAGTVVANIDKDGDFTALTVTSSGVLTVNDNLYVDNDVVGDVAARIDGTSGQTADLLQVRAYDGTEKVGVDKDGGLDLASSLKPASVTADPCTAAPYEPGSIFYNSTSNYMCFCDGSSADLKMNDNSTACF